MAVNLELKLKLNSFHEIHKNINLYEITHSKTLIQKDKYYKIPAGLLKLRQQNDSFELIKYNRNEIEGERWSNYFVLKISGENAENYFDDLFEIEAIVEKVRNLYIYKNTRIHLDEVKNLGEFLELETVVNNISKQIKKSYRDLILEGK